MIVSATARYATTSALLALAVAALVAGVAAPRGFQAVAWGLAGWAVMALFGVAGGAWAVSRHGAPGAGFLVAVGTCILSRLFAGAAVALAAASAGMAAVWAFFSAAAATYVVLQVFEVNWFLRHPQPVE